MRKALTVAAAVLLLSSLAYATQWVQDGVPEEPGDPIPLNCGEIHGTIGRIGDWTQTPDPDENAKKQYSGGEYGGLWGADTDHKNQYEMIPPQADAKDDTIFHRFEKRSGSPNYKFLKVTVWADPVLSGSSQLYKSISPQWWWTCDCNVRTQPPVAQYRIGSGDPITLPMQLDGNAADDSGHARGGAFDAGDQVDDGQVPASGIGYPVPAGHPHFPPNAPRGATPTSCPKPTNYPESENGYTNNDIHQDPLPKSRYGAHSTVEIPNDASTVEVYLKLTVDATVGCDNATVNEWKVALDVGFWTETLRRRP